MEKEICECKRDYKSPLSGICELCWDEKFPDEKETVEEASERYWAKQPYNEDAFIKGAKWQAERMYSEEDMIEFAKWIFLEVGSNTGKDRTNKELFNEWFKQFKKE